MKNSVVRENSSSMLEAGMELIAKANRQLRKSVTRSISTDEFRSAEAGKSIDALSVNNADLFCAIHDGPLRDPRRLPCAHSFCYQCLLGLQRTNAQNHKIVCPICRRSHDIDNIDELYIDYNLVRRVAVDEATEIGASSGGMDDEDVKMSRDISRTLKMLKEAELACDGAMSQIRQMNVDVTAMKASIVDKRKALESKFAAAKSLEEGTDDQHRVLCCLGYDCHFMQETIKKAQTCAFDLIREANVGVRHTSTLVKGAGLFNIWLKDENPMSDDQLKRATRLITQIWLSQDNPYQMITDEESARRARGEFAKRLATSFRNHFASNAQSSSIGGSSSISSSSASSANNDDETGGGGVWTAIVGAKKQLDFYVYSHREFYICMEIQKMRIVIYRCVVDADCRPVDPGRATLFETFVRQRLDDALRRRKKEAQSAVTRPAQYVSENLKQGLNGGLWHCVGGPSKTYAIHTTGERASQTVVTIDGYEYGVWQCNCAMSASSRRLGASRGNNNGSDGDSAETVIRRLEIQKGQTSSNLYSEEVEYDEPYCLD